MQGIREDYSRLARNGDAENDGRTSPIHIRSVSDHPPRSCRKINFLFNTGNQPFGHIRILTRPPVLIPRPETEYWTMKLFDLVSPTPQSPISVLDLCTGTGCIPLLLCHLWPKGSVQAYGVDISPDAIELAKDNASHCHISMESTRQQNYFIPSVADIRGPSFINSLNPPFDIVTSNPPYISRKEYELLPPCVKDYEDPRALLGDPDGSLDQNGLSFYHTIARLIRNQGFLSANAIVALEVGEEQANAVEDIMRREGGMRKTDIWKDPWGKNRTVVARN